MRQLKFAEQITGSIHRGGEQQYLAAGTREGRTSSGVARGQRRSVSFRPQTTAGRHVALLPEGLNCGQGVLKLENPALGGYTNNPVTIEWSGGFFSTIQQ